MRVDRTAEEGVGPRFVAASAAVLLVAFLLAGFAATRVAERGRSLGTPGRPTVVRVGDAKGLLAAWDSRSIHGATVISVSGSLGFTPVLYDTDVVPRPGYPVQLIDLAETYRSRIVRANRMWVAMHTGVARNLYHVLPESVLASRVADGRVRGLPGISADGRHVAANEEGYVHPIGADVPHVSEPVVLVVDATYFEHGSPEGLKKALDAAGLTYGLVVLDRATDDPTVDARARAGLDRFDTLFVQENR